MARISVYGSSTAYGLHDPEAGGFAERLKVTYMQRHALDRRHNRLVTVYNEGEPAQLIDETITSIEEDVARKIRRGHKGRMIAVLVLGNMDSALDKKTGEPKMSRRDFRTKLHELGELMAKLGVEPIYLGPTPIDDTKTHPYVNENGPGDYFDTDHRLALGEDVKEFAKKTDKPYVELWEALGGYYSWQFGFLSDDGLHVNEVGHKAIHDLVVPQADKLLYGRPWRSGPKEPPPEDPIMLETA